MVAGMGRVPLESPFLRIVASVGSTKSSEHGVPELRVCRPFRCMASPAQESSSHRPCIDCARRVPTRRHGRCSNCARIHDREHRAPNAECQACGRSYFSRKKDVAGRKVCSRECFAVWKRGRNAKNEHTDQATLIARACEHCRKGFEVEKRQVDRGYGTYCSLACSGARRGVDRIVLECRRCGSSFAKLPSRLLHSSLTFCSQACLRAECRARRVAPEPERSRCYRRFRDEVVTQHPRCARCGSDTDLAVHHRIPSRQRPDLLFERSNLEVLCRSCHAVHHARCGDFVATKPVLP
jgi:hypothetical protein